MVCRKLENNEKTCVIRGIFREMFPFCFREALRLVTGFWEETNNRI